MGKRAARVTRLDAILAPCSSREFTTASGENLCNLRHGTLGLLLPLLLIAMLEGGALISCSVNLIRRLRLYWQSCTQPQNRCIEPRLVVRAYMTRATASFGRRGFDATASETPLDLPHPCKLGAGPCR